MINYFSRYVFSCHLGYYGSYLDAFIFHCILLEQVELYSKQFTSLDEKGRNFFHNFIYNLYIIYNIKFCLFIQIRFVATIHFLPFTFCNKYRYLIGQSQS